MRILWSLIPAALLLSGCFVVFPRTYAIDSMDNNVCKQLQGRVQIHLVFVDGKSTGPWSAHDIRSTLDSVKVATRWLEEQAAQRGIPLTAEVVAHQADGVFPVVADLPKRSLGATVFHSSGLRQLDRWSDKAAKQAAQVLGPDTARIIRTRNAPHGTERLIARLRDIHQVDDVALMFMVNNYYKDDISVVVYTGSDDHVEYGVVSYKRPSVIAHEILHYFGAMDLYSTPFDKRFGQKRRKKRLMAEFPNEIMAHAQRPLSTLSIGPLTEYLIGWRKDIDPRHVRLLTGKRYRLVAR